jgi:hypothetical protein
MSGYFFTPQAQATPYSLYGFYQYGIGANGIGSSYCCFQDTSQGSSLSFPDIEQTVSRFGFSASLKMQGIAEPWKLRSFTDASADATGTIEPGQSHAIVETELGFTDTLYFGSMTLAMGTPISFTVTALLHSSLSVLGAPTVCSPGNPVPYAGFIDLYNPNVFGGTGKSVCPSPYPEGPGTSTQTLVQTFNSTVGGEAELTYRMRNWVSAGVQNVGFGNPGEYKEMIGDAYNTANFVVTVSTPGVTFRTASGVLPAAVPEPGSASLLGTALIGLIALLCCRR